MNSIASMRNDVSVDKEEVNRNSPGSSQEVSGTKESLQYNPIPISTGLREIDPKTLSPPTRNTTKRKAPKKGGLGGNASTTVILKPTQPSVKTAVNTGFFHFLKQGGRAESLNTPEFPPYLVTVEDVFFHITRHYEPSAYCQSNNSARKSPTAKPCLRPGSFFFKTRSTQCCANVRMVRSSSRGTPIPPL